MSQAIPVPESCCSPCPDATSSSIPGPAGPAGANGADGADGVSAFTYVANYLPAAQPVMPAEGGNVVVNVTSSTAAFKVNQFVFTDWGTMKIIAIPSDTSLTLENPENTAAGTYATNAAPGTSLPALSKITTAGEQGPAGAAGSGALLAANNLSDLVDVPTAQNNLALGTAATLTAGVANNNLPQVDDAAGLTVGEVLIATAAGIASDTAANIRTALGLGTMAVQDANNVNIQGGQMNGTLGLTTPDTTVADSMTVQGRLDVEGRTFIPTNAIQTLAAANTIAVTASKMRLAGSGGAVTLTSTPTITTPPTDGQRIILMGTDNVNTVTLQDESLFAGTKLRLAGGANFVLGLYDIIELLWDATTGFWTEISRSNN